MRPVDPQMGSESGSGSRRAKITHKNKNKSRNFMFSSAGCSLLRAEGFSCSLGVLYEGLGIAIYDKKNYNFFSFRLYFFQLLVIKILDPDRYLA
jgi:hypothetical protein